MIEGCSPAVSEDRGHTSNVDGPEALAISIGDVSYKLMNLNIILLLMYCIMDMRTSQAQLSYLAMYKRCRFVSTMVSENRWATPYADNLLLFHPNAKRAVWFPHFAHINTVAEWVSGNHSKFNCAKSNDMLVSRKKQPSTPYNLTSNEAALLSNFSASNILGCYCDWTCHSHLTLSPRAQRLKRFLACSIKVLWQHWLCSVSAASPIPCLPSHGIYLRSIELRITETS